MRAQDIHAANLREFIDYLASDIDESRPELQKQKDLLHLIDTDKEYAASHIVLRGRDTNNRVYLWCGWHPAADTSYMFLSAHKTDKDVPDSTSKDITLTVTYRNMESEDWYSVASSLVHGYSAPRDQAINTDDKLVAAVVLWLKGIAEEIRTGSTAIDKEKLLAEKEAEKSYEELTGAPMHYANWQLEAEKITPGTNR